MLKSNIYTKVAVLAALASVGSAVNAQESVTSSATVEISNAFDLEENTALNFGQIIASGYVYADGTDVGSLQATVVIPADGSGATAGTTGDADEDDDEIESSITILAAGNRALYDISNAAPYTQLTVTLPSTDITLTSSNAPASNGTFVMTDFTAYNVTNSTAVTTTITTDSAGSAQLAVGATLQTEAPVASGVGSLTYIDGSYTGSYSITVAY